MKKLWIFLSIVILGFAILAILNHYGTKEALKDNPYQKDDLNPATIEQLDDPNYQNIILPDQLKSQLEEGETETVYFYSPTCSWCKKMTPIVVSVAKELSIDVKLYNVLEFEEGRDDYNIEGTPTIIHFKQGKEVARKVGYDEKENLRVWFEQFVTQK
ncbi:thioredoxin family protein [Fervidibacillus halotolerans]|uniref:Thioredoxin family protein n=1 Tax=Fervidibacillus halotolerans TaxID=2980027 RepID=A0A9E8M015_9BACI|nr:thioredoxin family protein [Fervidibacillus halotolerans]WAA12968.1 thioredoxin family protein [Fervidibacillus halotolerans]